MSKKIIIALLITALAAVPLAGIALASGEGDGIEDHGPRNRYGGKVTAVDRSGGEFTIVNRRDQSFTFKVNEATEFHSRDGSLHSFEDLSVAMLVMVFAVGNEEGNLVAKHVIAINPNWLRGQGARGRVTAVGSSSFSIENRAGEELTFLVDDDTRFISRGGQVQSLDDLEDGMGVGVKFIEQEDGSLLAKAVLVGKPRPGHATSGSGRPGHPGKPGRSGSPDRDQY